MIWAQKVVLVTGASSGIGAAVAKGAAERGAFVALVARRVAALEAVAESIGAERSACFPLDVTDRSAIARLPGRVVERFGHLDVVVNNAGVNHRGAVAERSVDELASILETNLVAPVLLSRAAIDHLAPGGVIVNVASLAGKVPVPHEATYSATKAGLRAFTRALAFELSARALHVGAVCPGPVDTSFFGDVAEVPDLVFSQPMSSAEEVARAVFELVDERIDEVDVPATSGKLATLGYLAPGLFRRLRPLLERLGARNKRAFLSRKGTE